MARRSPMQQLGLPVLLGVVLVVIWLWPSPSPRGSSASSDVERVGASSTTLPSSGVSAAPPDDGSPISLGELPPEARETWALIDDGGPFPFERDGVVFSNFEGHLPDRPRGYYREYTVVTPGVTSRGARRLVVGGDGDVYYTDDHYDSFTQVVVDS